MTTFKEKLRQVDTCINGHGLDCKQRMAYLKSWLVQREFFNTDGTCRFCANLSYLQEVRNLNQTFIVKKDLWNRCFCTSNCVREVNLIWDNLKHFMCTMVGIDLDADMPISLEECHRAVNEIQIDCRPQGLFCMATQSLPGQISSYDPIPSNSTQNLEYDSEPERPRDHIDELLDEKDKYETMTKRILETYNKYNQQRKRVCAQLRDELGAPQKKEDSPQLSPCSSPAYSSMDDSEIDERIKTLITMTSDSDDSDSDDSDSEIEWSIPSPKKPIVDAVIDLSPPQSPVYEDDDSKEWVIDTSRESSPIRDIEAIPSKKSKKEQGPAIEFPSSPTPPAIRPVARVKSLQPSEPDLSSTIASAPTEELNPIYKQKYDNFLGLLADVADRLTPLPTNSNNLCILADAAASVSKPPTYRCTTKDFKKRSSTKSRRKSKDEKQDPAYHPYMPDYKFFDKYPRLERRSLRVAKIDPLDW